MFIFRISILKARSESRSNQVQVIKEASSPQNAKELNSFLCTVQYNARFMESFAPSTEKLRSLLKEKKFKWESEHHWRGNQPSVFRTQSRT